MLRATEKSRAAVVLLAERRRAARERKRQLRAVKAADGPHGLPGGKHPAGGAAGEAPEAGRPQLQLRRPQRLHEGGKDDDASAGDDEDGKAPQGVGALSTRDVIAAGVGVASAAAGIATEVITSSASS